MLRSSNESMVTNNDNNIHIGDCGQCPWRDGFLPVLGIQVSRSQQGIRLDVFPHSSSRHSDAKVSSGCFLSRRRSGTLNLGALPPKSQSDKHARSVGSCRGWVFDCAVRRVAGSLRVLESDTAQLPHTLSPKPLNP